MFQRNVGQRMDPVVTLVQAGDEMEFLAAGGKERLLALDADFLERLQAVGDESRADHIHAPYALPGEILEGGRRVGLEPFRAAGTGTWGVPWMKRATSSKALAVVLAAYCGYSGSTRIRSQPAPLRRSSAPPIE